MKNIIISLEKYAVLALVMFAIASIGMTSVNMAMAQVPSPCINNPELCKDLELGGKLPSQISLSEDIAGGLDNRFFQFLGDMYDGAKYAAGLIFDGLKYAYEAFGDYFFSRTPLPIAPVDLDSVPSSPDSSKPPAGGSVTPAPGTITQSCYSSEVTTLKYSECGRTYQTKKAAVLYSDSAATLIPMYAKEYDECVDAVYANRCK